MKGKRGYRGSTEVGVLYTISGHHDHRSPEKSVEGLTPNIYSSRIPQLNYKCHERLIILKRKEKALKDRLNGTVSSQNSPSGFALVT